MSIRRDMSHTVLIVDDHDIVRFGLETLIGATPELKLVGAASSARQALDLIAQRRPDLVITDMTLGDSKGLDTVRSILDAQAPRKVLVMSMHDEMLYGEPVLGMGASGYVMKEQAHMDMMPAIRAVLRGETWVSHRLNAKILNRALQRASPAAVDSSASLTRRELEVLEQLRAGKTTKEIASKLNLSARTVDVHRASIKRKLGLRTGVELVVYATTKT